MLTETVMGIVLTGQVSTGRPGAKRSAVKGAAQPIGWRPPQARRRRCQRLGAVAVRAAEYRRGSQRRHDGEEIARTAGRGLTIPTFATTNTPLVVVLSNDGCEIERATAQNGKCAVKAALLMLAKRDALRAGDILRVEADGVVAEVPKKKTGRGYGAAAVPGDIDVWRTPKEKKQAGKG